MPKKLYRLSELADRYYTTPQQLSYQVGKHRIKKDRSGGRIVIPLEEIKKLDKLYGYIEEEEIAEEQTPEEQIITGPLAKKDGQEEEAPPKEETLKNKKEPINLQQQINPGGDEMPVENAELNALEQRLGRETDGLRNVIENTKKDLQILRDEKVPQRIAEKMKPLEDKVASGMAEVTASTAALSGTLKDLQKSLSDEVARQAEAKKETEVIRGELEETTKKADGISALGEELKTNITGVLEEKTKDLDEKLAQLPTEERVKELVEACVLDPKGSACQRLDELERTAKGEEEVAPTEAHSTAKELLSCPTCGPAVAKRILEAISKHGKGEISDTVMDAMSSAGYQTGQELKEEEAPPEEEEAPPESPGVEETVAAPAGF